MEAGHNNFERRDMVGPSVDQMLGDFFRELALHKGDPAYSARNLAGAVARTFGGTKDGPETERTRDRILSAFIEDLVRNVVAKDTDAGIDQTDMIEEVVRDSGVPEIEVADFVHDVTKVLRKPARKEQPARAIRRPTPRFNRAELESLRKMKERRDHELPNDDIA